MELWLTLRRPQQGLLELQSTRSFYLFLIIQLLVRYCYFIIIIIACSFSLNVYNATSVVNSFFFFSKASRHLPLQHWHPVFVISSDSSGDYKAASRIQRQKVRLNTGKTRNTFRPVVVQVYL